LFGYNDKDLKLRHFYWS